MKTLFTLIIAVCLLSISCKDTPKHTQTEPEQIATDTIIVDSTALSLPTCYLYAVDKDSISLRILENKETVEGLMTYNFYQIDGSSGTFAGIRKGDTIIGVYNFEAEGTNSRRELVFLKSEDGLILGKGETQLVENTELFKKGTPFVFENGRFLEEVNCNQL